MNKVLIIGATSGIASAVAEQLAAKKCNVILAGRDNDQIQTQAADLQIRFGIKAYVIQFEALDYHSHSIIWKSIIDNHEDLDGVIVCYGYLGNQELGQQQFSESRSIMEINFLSYVSLLNIAANYFEPLRKGFICAISSVAGDRGRKSNYLYGAAKGALSIYLQGLRNRLNNSNVAVITIKPGFVNTKMTYGMKGMFLVAEPQKIALGIYHAILKRKSVVYLPGFWRWIMFIIRNIPEFIFKKMSL